jgi:streptomycin 6-kinase
MIPDPFAQRMRAIHGAAGDLWLAQLPVLLDRCCRRWNLTLEAPYESLSYNYAVRVLCSDDRRGVLKIGIPNAELLTEIEALTLYEGRGCARLLAVDPAIGALLLERLTPGIMLASEEDDEKATRIAADVMQQLWRPLPAVHSFPTVARWARGLERLRATFGGGTGPFPHRLVEAAEDLFGELLPSSQQPVLLHGDLHHYNILAAERRPWLAIDPKGLSGEPLYETGAWLRNPMPQVATWPDLRRLLAQRIAILAECLEADRGRIQVWAIAQAVLSSWWSYEDEGAVGKESLQVAEALLTLYER